MKIFIIGSEGFIGNRLTETFTKSGWDVFGCDFKEVLAQKYKYSKIISGRVQFSQIFAFARPDVCINAAGSGDISFSFDSPVEDFDRNCVDTAFILDAIRTNCPNCRYLHISSAAVYGNPQRLPMHETDPRQPLSPYGWHKLMAEHLCSEYTKCFGLKTVFVRPFSVYGPGLKKQIFWDLYQKFTKNKFEVELWGTGNESRDFIHVSDLATALYQIVCKSEFNAQDYNVATGVETTIHEAAALLLRELNPLVKIRFNQQDMPGTPSNWRADISKLRSLGFQPSLSIVDGLKELALWLKNLN